MVSTPMLFWNINLIRILQGSSPFFKNINLGHILIGFTAIIFKYQI